MRSRTATPPSCAPPCTTTTWQASPNATEPLTWPGRSPSRSRRGRGNTPRRCPPPCARRPGGPSLPAGAALPIPGLARGSAAGRGGGHGRVVQVTGDRLGRGQLAEQRFLLLADGHRERAPRVEMAARRAVNGIRDIAGERGLDFLPLGGQP